VLDARLILSGPVDAADAAATGGVRPEVFVGLRGPLGAPKRSVDVAAFSGWLTLRAVERQAKQLERLEADRKEVTATTPPATEAPTRSITTAPAAPAPAIVPDATEPPQAVPARPSPAPRRALAPVPPPAESLPGLSPPIEIRPAPEPRSNPNGLQKSAPPRPRANPLPADPPAAARRSVLDQLFGPQR